MEDDHVDRPGVEERQRLKLTGTNSSIGLIVLITYAHHQRNPKDCRRRNPKDCRLMVVCPRGSRLRRRLRAGPRKGSDARSRLRTASENRDARHEKQLLEQRALCRPGGYGGAAAPDPIPNSAVKRSSADGTSSQDAGE